MLNVLLPMILALSANPDTKPLKIQAKTDDEIYAERGRCNAFVPGYRDIVPQKKIFRPGDKVPFEVGAQTGTYGLQKFPDDCLAAWKVMPEGIATFDKASKTLIISDQAPARAEITLSVIFDGAILSRTIKVTGRDAVVLTGTRSQKDGPDCPSAERVGEIEFKDNGRFGVTYQPFETYIDYWGSYSFNPATGALKMAADGGNFTPANIDLEGKAWLEPNGLLHLDGFNLGGRTGYYPPPPLPGEAYVSPPECRYIFYAAAG